MPASTGSSEDERRLCPSARCEPGATLLGVVNADGSVGYLTPAVRIDEEFVARARKGRPPERRFRFAAPCVESGCRQWTGSRCGVIDGILASPVEPAEPAAHDGLPHCAIRSACRWFHQSGPEACAACPLVITDTGTVTNGLEAS
jgi:hypothetical protein